jgi:hypothetical protein
METFDEIKTNVINALNEIKYKKQMKNGIMTVWFHKGNGWNFRVSYHFYANQTRVVRYYTNGHMNSVGSKQKLNGLHITTNYQDAESLFCELLRP